MNATTTQIPNPLQNQQAEKAIHAKPKPDPTPLEQVHSALDKAIFAFSVWDHEQSPILAKRLHDLKDRVNAAVVGVPIRDPKVE